MSKIINRRRFFRDTAIATAGITLGSSLNRTVITEIFRIFIQYYE
jgi:hypothetical protein